VRRNAKKSQWLKKRALKNVEQEWNKERKQRSPNMGQSVELLKLTTHPAWFVRFVTVIPKYSGSNARIANNGRVEIVPILGERKHTCVTPANRLNVKDQKVFNGPINERLRRLGGLFSEWIN
jgi:hypothetical protein